MLDKHEKVSSHQVLLITMFNLALWSQTELAGGVGGATLQMLSYHLVNSNVTLKVLLAFVVLRLPFNSQSLRFLQQIANFRM